MPESKEPAGGERIGAYRLESEHVANGPDGPCAGKPTTPPAGFKNWTYNDKASTSVGRAEKQLHVLPQHGRADAALLPGEPRLRQRLPDRGVPLAHARGCHRGGPACGLPGDAAAGQDRQLGGDCAFTVPLNEVVWRKART